MRPRPSYHTFARAWGTDTVVMDDFGPVATNRTAAHILVDGQPVVVVAYPETRFGPGWNEAAEGRFRAAVRELAATHDLLEKTGPVSVVFDPPEGGGNQPGEPIDRA